MSKTVPSLPAIAHKSETSTATKFKIPRPILPGKGSVLLYLSVTFDLCPGTKVVTCDVNMITR